MEQKRKTRMWCGFLLLLILLAVFLIWNLFAGSVQLSASQIGQILLGGGDDLTQKQIIMQIRLPRMASALILGGALSVSGYLLQTFFHNPIAGPFVLGISSGAKLAVSLVMIFLLSRGVRSSSGAAHRRCVHRRDALDGPHPAHLAAGQSDEPSRRLRCDDRLHLLSADGFSRHVRGRFKHREPAQLVERLVFRHEVGKRDDDGLGVQDRADFDIFPLQADPRLPARRGLRAQHGRADQGVPRGAHPALQRVICLRDGLRRPHLVCRASRCRT